MNTLIRLPGGRQLGLTTLDFHEKREFIQCYRLLGETIAKVGRYTIIYTPANWRETGEHHHGAESIE